MDKVYPSDEAVVLRATIRAMQKQLDTLTQSLDAKRMKKMRDKLSEYKGNILAVVSQYRKEHTLVVRMSERERAFKDIFRLVPPFDGDTQCRVEVDEPKLFSYFAKYGNPKITKGDTTP